jgi:hypothetical protein
LGHTNGQKEAIIFSFVVHFYVAAVIWLIFWYFGIIYNPLPMLIGALFPDADTRKSVMGRLIPLWLLFKHRGFTHKLPCLALTTAILWVFFNESIAASWFFGYLSHVFIDKFSGR